MAKLLKHLLLLTLLISKAVTAETVTLATLDWPPYIGPSLKNDGYVTEIVVSAFKEAGIETDIEYMTWARAELVTTEGKRDGLFPEYYGKERAKTHLFSDPFPGGPVGFLKRIDTDIEYTTLTDLTKHRIGVVRGYINTEEFDNADYLNKDAVSSDVLNLRKLIRKRLELVVIDKLVAQYTLQQEIPDALPLLEFMEPALEQKDLYIAFSKQAKNAKKKLQAFNLGLQKLKESGQLDAILKKHGF